MKQIFCPNTREPLKGMPNVRGCLSKIALIAVIGLHALSAAGPPLSAFFSSAAEESFPTYQIAGDGDLWPACWAGDGNLYTANGDGSGFAGGGLRFDMAVSRIAGMPPHLSGTTLATNVGTNWSGPGYNRKPTGMLCVNHSIYLAFQNLNLKNFSDAPAASIARSSDRGKTWTWSEAAPMFGNPADPKSPEAYKFTTIFFLDFGRNSFHARDSYVYAYGLDNNWREQKALYLARIPKADVQIRSAWRFYAGVDTNGNPTWSGEISAKTPVLIDERLLYVKVSNKGGCYANQPVLSQGGVVFDAPLRRYIFASWSCTTHEFFEAPEPWGPWKLFLSKDFGPFRPAENRGQYGTNIPSKFISPDGKVLYVQSNVCCGGNSYTYALRKLYLEPYDPSEPSNALSDDNLAVSGAGVRGISKSTRRGGLCGIDCSNLLNNGNANESEDDNDGEDKETDWWGYTWSRAYNLNKVVYEIGAVSSDGGWFSGDLRVQVRQNAEWTDVTGLSINPVYPFAESLRSHTVFTLRFDSTWGDGVRIIGIPGGASHFTSIAELAVYYDSGNLVSDGSFEFQLGPMLSGLWTSEGPDPKGITRYETRGHSGVNNAWVTSSTGNWNAIVQKVPIQPHTDYRLSTWVRSNLTGQSGRFGVRTARGHATLFETSFGAAPQYMRLSVQFNSGAESEGEVYVGFSGENAQRWLQIDDVSVWKK